MIFSIKFIKQRMYILEDILHTKWSRQGLACFDGKTLVNWILCNAARLQQSPLCFGHESTRAMMMMSILIMMIDFSQIRHSGNTDCSLLFVLGR